MAPQITAKPLKTERLQGISTNQLKQHYELYTRYVATTNRIRTALQEAERENANPNYSPYRELKVEESYNWDAVKLHELYFWNLGGTGGVATGRIRALINRDFGSFNDWKTDFTAAGKSARGWVILAYDCDDKTLHNYLQDAHNLGVMWRAIPLLVLDVYEHAYFIDFGINRAKYLEAFFANIDWEEINRRLGATPACPPPTTPLDAPPRPAVPASPSVTIYDKKTAARFSGMGNGEWGFPARDLSPQPLKRQRPESPSKAGKFPSQRIYFPIRQEMNRLPGSFLSPVCFSYRRLRRSSSFSASFA